jgi:predicted nuclease of predicted toxin-antitoxin system
MSRILLNENLPASLVATLETAGLEAVHVRDLGLQGQPDGDIWRRAQAEGLVIMTKDLDYLDLVVATGSGRVAVLALGNAGNRELKEFVLANVALLQEFLASDEKVVILSK